MDSVLIYEAIIVALVCAFLAVQISMPLAKRAGLIDMPGVAPHKTHTLPTPLAGGMALMLALLVSSLIFGFWDEPMLSATLLASVIVFVFGLWDDWRNISPLKKLFGQLLATVLLIRLGVFVRIFESPEFFFQTPDALALVLDWAVTIVWIVGITNAFNFVDSMDGLAVGLGGLAAGFFMLVTLDSAQPELSLFTTLLVGVCLGLYFYNAQPARLFLGDAGAQTLGFILAAVAIIFAPTDAYQTSSWFVTVMVLGVPIFDMCLVVFSRLRRRQPVYRSARDHTYHLLRARGLDSNRVVLVMHLASLVLGCLAAISLKQAPIIANTLFLFTILVGGGLILFLDHQAN